MPFRVKSKGPYVAVPATARAPKHLVAARDRTAIDTRAVSHDACARRLDAGLNRRPDRLDGCPAERSHSTRLGMFDAATGDSRCRFRASHLRMPLIRAARDTAALPRVRNAAMPLPSYMHRNRPHSLQPRPGPEVRRRVNRTQWAARSVVIASRRTPASVFATTMGARDVGGASSSAVA